MEAYVVSSVAGILTERKELRANKQQSDSEKNNQFSLNNQTCTSLAQNHPLIIIYDKSIKREKRKSHLLLSEDWS